MTRFCATFGNFCNAFYVNKLGCEDSLFSKLPNVNIFKGLDHPNGAGTLGNGKSRVQRLS